MTAGVISEWTAGTLGPQLLVHHQPVADCVAESVSFEVAVLDGCGPAPLSNAMLRWQKRHHLAEWDNWTILGATWPFLTGICRRALFLMREPRNPMPFHPLH
jgi:hypothetical protein